MRYIIAVAVLLLASAAWAQDIDAGNGIKVNVANGWQTAEPSKGVAALFRLPGDPKTRLELRMVEVDSPEQAERYFTSYHASLLAKGLSEIQKGTPKKYGEIEGIETRYGGTSGGETFELVLFQFTHNRGAWFVIGFATGRRVDAMYTAFSEVAGSIKRTTK